MAKPPSLSGAHSDLVSVGRHHAVVEAAVREYCDPALPGAMLLGMTPDEVRGELAVRLTEEDHLACLSVLAAVEAAFRVDFWLRVRGKRSLDLASHFRQVAREQGRRISLDDDILGGWQTHVPATKRLVGEWRGAMNYRNWLAHGRYFAPKLGRPYDFAFLFGLATRMTHDFPLLLLSR